MLRILYFVVCTIGPILGASSLITKDVKGYYWRDYSGEIPPDAYQGGSDTTGKPIYIGQIYDQFLIPAKIYLTDRKKAFYELNDEERSVTENIKILCTRHPEQFEWVATNNDRINLITDKHLVLGGYQPGCTTYIGRVRAGGEVAIGKALTDNDPMFKGLHIIVAGRKELHTSFQVLAFNNTYTSTLPYFDVRFSPER